MSTSSYSRSTTLVTPEWHIMSYRSLNLLKSSNCISHVLNLHNSALHTSQIGSQQVQQLCPRSLTSSQSASRDWLLRPDWLTWHLSADWTTFPLCLHSSCVLKYLEPRSSYTSRALSQAAATPGLPSPLPTGEPFWLLRTTPLHPALAMSTHSHSNHSKEINP